jgi:predicted membrane protein
MEPYNHQSNNNRNSSATAGYVLVAIGGIVLLSQIAPGLFSMFANGLRGTVNFIRGFFRWELIPICIGLAMGLKRKFGAPYGWLVPIAVGTFFIVSGTIGWNYLFPILLIAFGIVILMNAYTKPKIAQATNGSQSNITSETTERITKTAPESTASAWNSDYTASSTNSASSSSKTFGTDDEKKTMNITSETMGNVTDDDGYFSVNCIFSGTEKTVNSKNFKGADIVAIFGGVEVNLLNADMPSPAIMDVTSIFGGVKLIVPPHWEVKSQITTIMGGLEDKRPQLNTNLLEKKVLILKGTAVLGGIDIKSF